VLAVFIVLLSVIFYSMVQRITAMTFTVGDNNEANNKEQLLTILPQWLFLIALVVLGLKLPSQVHSMLKEAAVLLGGI